MTSDDAQSVAKMTPAVTGGQTRDMTGFNLKTAAELAGVSVSTMRRRRSELLQYGATVTEDGIWNIPITALEAAGLMQRTTPDPVAEPVEKESLQPIRLGPEETKTGNHLAEALERIQELEREALEQRHRAELAEVRLEAAEQRARAAEVLAEDRRKTLEVERRMLPPGPSAYAQPESSAPTVQEPKPPATNSLAERSPHTTTSQQESERQSWWRRTFG